MSGLFNALAGLLMATRQGIITIHETAVGAPQQKQLAVAKHHNVHHYWEGVAVHNYPSTPAGSCYGAGVPNVEQPQFEAALSRRVEEASLNAWPAMQQILLDGWLLRFSRGFTKRANSIVPLYPSLQPIQETLPEKVRYCENLYAREQLRTIFRLTSMVDRGQLDDHLHSHGYVHTEPTQVLSATLGDVPQAPGFALLPQDEWLEVYAHLTDMPITAQLLHDAILAGIQGSCGFAVLRVDGNPVACGLGVVEQDLLGLFDIVTHPAHRRSGHGAELVRSLLNWGKGEGAVCGYLQVVADNQPAQILYKNLGFEPLYNYWYRVSA
jgi:ribosomal protein S18 acetylase RimI-like enzyme